MKFTLRATFDAAAIERDGRHYLLIEQSEFCSIFDTMYIEPEENDLTPPAAPPTSEFVEECFNLLRLSPMGLTPWEIERLLREDTKWGFAYKDIEAALQSLLLVRRVTLLGLCLWRASDRIAIQETGIPSDSPEVRHETDEGVGEPARNFGGCE